MPIVGPYGGRGGSGTAASGSGARGPKWADAALAVAAQDGIYNNASLLSWVSTTEGSQAETDFAGLDFSGQPHVRVIQLTNTNQYRGGDIFHDYLGLIIDVLVGGENRGSFYIAWEDKYNDAAPYNNTARDIQIAFDGSNVTSSLGYRYLEQREVIATVGTWSHLIELVGRNQAIPANTTLELYPWQGGGARGPAGPAGPRGQAASDIAGTFLTWDAP